MKNRTLRSLFAALLALSFLAGCASDMGSSTAGDKPKRERIPDSGY